MQGLLTKATSLSFPTSHGVMEQLADFVDDIISAFINAITAIWSAIVAFFTTVADFILTVWNKIKHLAIGSAIELVSSVVTIKVQNYMMKIIMNFICI